MGKVEHKRSLGIVEIAVDLSDPQLLEAIKGPPGKKGDSIKGDPGEKGDKSTEPGPPGRPPTAQEIDAAVVRYLSGKDLRGKPGKDGEDGDKGDEPSDARLKALIKEVLAERLGG